MLSCDTTLPTTLVHAWASLLASNVGTSSAALRSKENLTRAITDCSAELRAGQRLASSNCRATSWKASAGGTLEAAGGAAGAALPASDSPSTEYWKEGEAKQRCRRMN